MRKNVGITLIIFFSCLAITALYLITEKHEKQVVKMANKVSITGQITNVKGNVKNGKNDLKSLPFSAAKAQVVTSKPLSSEDEELILSVSSLSEDILNLKLGELVSLAQKDRLGTLLELKEVDSLTKDRARKILEKIALMRLEKTRRKFIHMDEELKDPLLAHRNSLKEIREVLMY